MIEIESQNNISREQVVEAFKKFVAQGITNPDDLPANNDSVAANKLLDEWTEQEMKKAKKTGGPKADLLFSLGRTTIFIDAGFSDPEHLEEVSQDWLPQELDNAQAEGLTEVENMIQAKISEIEEKLADQ